MPQLTYTPSAGAAVKRLLDDPTADRHLRERVVVILRQLGEDPGVDWVRRQRMATDALGRVTWVVLAPGRDESWWIAWQQDDEAIAVVYAGAEP